MRLISVAPGLREIGAPLQELISAVRWSGRVDTPQPASFPGGDLDAHRALAAGRGMVAVLHRHCLALGAGFVGPTPDALGERAGGAGDRVSVVLTVDRGELSRGFASQDVDARPLTVAGGSRLAAVHRRPARESLAGLLARDLAVGLLGAAAGLAGSA